MALAVTLTIILFLVAALTWLQRWSSNRTWIALWRGSQVVLRNFQGKLILELDGERIFEKSRPTLNLSKHTYTQACHLPSMGDTEIAVSTRSVGSQGDYTLELQIGEDLVPLTELTHFFGRITQEKGALFKKLNHNTIEPLGDPRWIAACSILNSVRQSTSANNQIREAANLLQVEMRHCFESRLRLSDDSVDLIGGDISEVKSILEEKIGTTLEAVKSLHMATISREANADESEEMRRVQETLQYLDAEEEVDKYIASLQSSVGSGSVNATEEVSGHAVKESVEVSSH